VSQFDRLAQDVATFSLATFGSQGPLPCAIKCRIEAEEFVDNPSIDEAADVLITILSWCGQVGHTADDLLAAAEAKMRKNRARKWLLLEDGTYQHVGGS